MKMFMEADECGSLAEFNAPALAMQYSFSNFSLKNLSQLASINFDLVVKKPPNHLFHDKFIRLLWPTYIIPLMIYSYSFLVNSTCLTIGLLCGLKKIFSLLPDLI